MFAITKKSTTAKTGALWRSTDGGTTFGNMNPALLSSAGAPADSEVDIIAVLTQKDQPQNIMFIASDQRLWLTHDYGNTLKAMKTTDGLGDWSGAYTSFRLHPTKPQWLLMLTRRPNCKAIDDVQATCPFDLLVTQNAFEDSMQVLPHGHVVLLHGGTHFMCRDHESPLAYFIRSAWLRSRCAGLLLLG